MKEKKSTRTRTPNRSALSRKETAPLTPPAPVATTRKTIEVPGDYFYWVKLTAVKRRMREKELWAEILCEYFTRHPAE